MFFDAIIAAGGRPYLIGGAVRDKLLGRKAKDADYLVAGLRAEVLEDILSAYGAVHAVGKSFGVLRFTPERSEETYEFALPRIEESTGDGHRDFSVRTDPHIPVRWDLMRRDFTINALAIDLRDGGVVDAVGGRRDLADGVLRAVSRSAFKEDPLRILRGAQLAARLGFKTAPETVRLMAEAAPLLKSVSPERTAAELAKLLGASRPSTGFLLLEETGALGVILPELAALRGIPQPNKYHRHDALGHTLAAVDAAATSEHVSQPGHPVLMWAALLHDAGKAVCADRKPNGDPTFPGHQLASARIAREILRRLRVSTVGVDPDQVATLVENHMFCAKPDFADRAIRRFIRKIGVDLIDLQIDLRIADNLGGRPDARIGLPLAMRERVQQILSEKPAFGLKDLAVNGRDIMEELGIPAGPEIGHILNNLLEMVLDEPEKNAKRVLIEAAQEIHTVKI